MAYDNIDGQISRIYVHSAGCSVRVHGYGDRYFKLGRSHSNYSPIYAALLSASLTGQQIRLRLGDYNPPEPASSDILYIVADLPEQ